MQQFSAPRIYTRAMHPISRNNISKNALTVLYGLHKAGYRALLVGGCLRDLLLGVTPKDFDVVTDATPEQVRACFRNCRIIGRRFRLAHVHFHNEIIEVATFRDASSGQTDEDGRVIHDNHFGTIETDVVRRDFTINALYYDIANFSLIDYVGAIEDIQEGIIRLIGDPETRYTEDPVRIVRALRFAAKLKMRLSPETEQAIQTQKHLLASVPPARLYDEMGKLFLTGHGLASYHELRIHDMFPILLPELSKSLKDFSQPNFARNQKLITLTLKLNDELVKNNKPSLGITFIYAVLLWPTYYQYLTNEINRGTHWHAAIIHAVDNTFAPLKSLGIPQTHRANIREIWIMQSRLSAKISPKKIKNILQNETFETGLLFLQQRFLSGEKQLENTYQKWFQIMLDNDSLTVQHKSRKSKKAKKS